MVTVILDKRAMEKRKNDIVREMASMTVYGSMCFSTNERNSSGVMWSPRVELWP